jgi:hypothetical protein
MKLISLLLLVTLLPSCGLKGWRQEKNESLNASALYDPVTVTLIEGKQYSFAEGTLVGRGQKFHSDYSYQRALIIGNLDK